MFHNNFVIAVMFYEDSVISIMFNEDVILLIFIIAPPMNSHIPQTCRIPSHYFFNKIYAIWSVLVANCNMMAEGFRFMRLGLVRVKTFRLRAWVT